MTVNNELFSASLKEILSLILSVLKDFEQNNKIGKSLENMKRYCNLLKENADKSDFDTCKIIKKIYKTINAHIDCIINRDLNFFSLKNKNAEIVTLIPGINLGSIVKICNEDHVKILWTHIYMMYLTSIKMISVINKKIMNEKMLATIDILKQYIVDSKIIKFDSWYLNQFVLNFSDDNKCDHDIKSFVEQMTKAQANTTDQTSGNNPSILNVIKNVDMNKFKDSLQNISNEDIDGATKNIVKMIGVNDGDEDSSEITDVCSQLVSNVVDDLKNAKDLSSADFINIIKSIATNATNNIEKDKLKKVVKRFGKTAEGFGGANMKNGGLENMMGNMQNGGLENMISNLMATINKNK